MIIIIESSDNESDMECQDAQDTAPQVSLEDSLEEEELETSQPLLHDTAPVLEVQPNTLYLEREENTLVQKFLTDGCGCNLADGGQCSSMFTVEGVEDYRSQCSELTRAELDMAILGQLSAFTNTSTLTVHSSRHRHAPANRQRTYVFFWHGGKRVCKKMFLFLHTISKKRLENLQESFRENGLAP